MEVIRGLDRVSKDDIRNGVMGLLHAYVRMIFEGDTVARDQKIKARWS
jgi:hypothetical protein